MKAFSADNIRYGRVVLAAAFITAFIFQQAHAADMISYDLDEDGRINMSLTGQDGDPVKGAGVAANRKLGNCMACHQITALSDQAFHGEIGPALDGVADRYDEGELRSLVVNPKIYFAETVMPGFYRTDGLHRVMKGFEGKPILTAAEVEHVVAFLKTLKD